MKLLHMADVHLGAEPDRDKPWGEGRGAQIWEAFAQALEEAERQAVDLVLIAGDLFHRQPLKRELKEVNYLFSRLSHAQVVLMAGNHDYLSKNSAYRNFPWNDNVCFFEGEYLEAVEFPKLRTVVYGLSYEHREIREPLYRGIQKAGRNQYHILLAHGGDEQHIPIQLRELEQMGFDYIALGHIHKPRQIKENRIIMAGSLQPQDCTELGSRGYWITELSGDTANACFYPVRGWEYVCLTVELDKRITNLELLQEIRDRIKEAEEQQIFQVLLTGRHDPDLVLDTRAIQELDRVASVVTECMPDYDFGQLKREQEHLVIGRFIREIESMTPGMVSQKALYYGVDALMGK